MNTTSLPSTTNAPELIAMLSTVAAMLPYPIALNVTTYSVGGIITSSNSTLTPVAADKLVTVNVVVLLSGTGVPSTVHSFTW